MYGRALGDRESRKAVGQGPAMGGSDLRILLAMLCVLVLPACAMTETGYAPRNFYGVDKDIAELETLDASLTTYFQSNATTASRNEFIARRLALYDLEYLRFTQNFRLGRAEADTLFDHAMLGLSLATTLSSGEDTKTALGAIMTALTGGRASIEKNFYADKTSSAMVSQMTAERKAALVPILDGASKPIEKYSMDSAFRDLNAYRAAGTVDGALEAFQKAAAKKDEVASAAIEEYRTAKFGADDNTLRIRKYLFPTMVKLLNNQAVDASGAVIAAPDPSRLASLQAEMHKLNLDQVLPVTFMNAAAFADERAKVVLALNIP
jgi:hypothetical protein